MRRASPVQALTPRATPTFYCLGMSSPTPTKSGSVSLTLRCQRRPPSGSEDGTEASNSQRRRGPDDASVIVPTAIPPPSDWLQRISSGIGSYAKSTHLVEQIGARDAPSLGETCEA